MDWLFEVVFKVNIYRSLIKPVVGVICGYGACLVNAGFA